MKSKLDILAAILYVSVLICGVIYGFSMVRDRQGNVTPVDWVH